jgi:uncharacterized phage-associated protein
MTFSPVTVSNNILKRAFNEDVSVSPMKLQKLLYFIASDYAKATKKPLLSEPFQAWDYGPVVRSVYDEFRSFGGGPIRKFAKDAQGKARIIKESSYPEFEETLDRVWSHTKDLSAVRLSRITHLRDSAWFKTFKREPRSGLIDETDLKEDETYLEPLGLRSMAR